MTIKARFTRVMLADSLALKQSSCDWLVVLQRMFLRFLHCVRRRPNHQRPSWADDGERGRKALNGSGPP